ncbi:MAG TPA: hypothetical protein VF240_13030 [Pyrinomonadaceae bacterium]
MRRVMLAVAGLLLLAPAPDARAQTADVIKDFDAWALREMSGLNAALAAKQLQPVPMLTREEWEKTDGQIKG